VPQIRSYRTVGEEQADLAERLVRILNALEDCELTALVVLDALSMSHLKLVEDRSGASTDAYRHAVEEMKGR